MNALADTLFEAWTQVRHTSEKQVCNLDDVSLRAYYVKDMIRIDIQHLASECAELGKPATNAIDFAGWAVPFVRALYCDRLDYKGLDWDVSVYRVVEIIRIDFKPHAK